MHIMIKILIASVLVIFGPAGTASGEEEKCPEIDSSLRFELYKTYKEYEIAVFDVFSISDQQILTQHDNAECVHVVELNPSVNAVLLKKKRKREFKVVVAEPDPGKSQQKWIILELGDFLDDVPSLGKPRGGIYSDVVTNEKLTVTRNSVAVEVELYGNGKKFVYKRINKAEFQSCQAK